MNIYECKAKAENEGFDSMEFIGLFPAGPMNCKWLDAYMGLFLVDHEQLKGGFITVSDFPDLECLPIEGSTGCFD